MFMVLKGAYKSYFVFSTGATVVAIAGAWWWRPIPETKETIALGNGPVRTAGMMSDTPWTDHADKERPFALELAASFTISFTALIGRLFLFYAGHTDVRSDENYHNFLKAVTNHALQGMVVMIV